MKKINAVFEILACRVAVLSGTTPVFIIALSIVVIWGLTGPLFHYSETWQLVINTGTTIITFLMVFLIQKSQNKESRALQIKLNELVASHQGASNRIIGVEDLTEDELIVLQKFYSKLALMAKKDANLLSSHSIDEAKENHEMKKEQRKRRSKTRHTQGDAA